MSCILLATVALEPNRWSAERRPSIRASEWAVRALADGFDGIELWENHFLQVEADERSRQCGLAVGGRGWIYNSYRDFQAAPEAEASAAADAAAIRALNASAVKFNVGPDPALNSVYRDHLEAWCALLPVSCSLLCECHAGTILETPEAACSFFSGFAVREVGFIVHPVGSSPERLEAWLETGRVRHVHVQSRAAPLSKDPEAWERLQMIGAAAPKVSYSIEFSWTTARPGETPEASYRAALEDARALRRIVESP